MLKRKGKGSALQNVLTDRLPWWPAVAGDCWGHLVLGYHFWWHNWNQGWHVLCCVELSKGRKGQPIWGKTRSCGILCNSSIDVISSPMQEDPIKKIYARFVRLRKVSCSQQWWWWNLFLDFWKGQKWESQWWQSHGGAMEGQKCPECWADKSQKVFIKRRIIWT